VLSKLEILLFVTSLKRVCTIWSKPLRGNVTQVALGETADIKDVFITYSQLYYVTTRKTCIIFQTHLSCWTLPVKCK